jgi:GNAT superfamily N-acetyltransferase
MQVEIQSLNSTHNRKQFDCGVQPLNNWFINMAGQQHSKELAKVFVAVDISAPNNPLGYYALIATQVDGSEIPGKKLPNFVPAILLGRFAVDQHLQGKGLGKILLMNALERVAMISQNVGVMVVVVHAKDQKAMSFYSRYGFRSCPSDPLQMFLPVDTIKNLL